MNTREIKKFLDKKVKEYNQPAFISSDPICIPHQFSKKQDIEIAGFFAAVFAWGNRITIINKSNELMQLMDGAPHQFITGHAEKELQKLFSFKHRTFNTTDLLYFIMFLKHHYSEHKSLEDAFIRNVKNDSPTGGGLVGAALVGFHNYFFSFDDAPARTKKHIATPLRGSTCKRLCMFLRWMVRCDNAGVDFGIWKKIAPSQLISPIDVHVARVARELGLIQRKQIDWITALELTERLKVLDKTDPIKYDFALFGMGVAPALPFKT